MRTVMLIIALMLSLAACAREPETISLTAITYSYGEAYADLRVNGQWAGKGANSVKPGDVTGGASICCIEIVENAKTATVTVQTGLNKQYVTEASIEQPWTQYPHYATVHLLPGRKVVIEITALEPAPRIDLLVSSLKAIGLNEYHIQAPHMWNSGPAETLK